MWEQEVCKNFPRSLKNSLCQWLKEHGTKRKRKSCVNMVAIILIKETIYDE